VKTVALLFLIYERGGSMEYIKRKLKIYTPFTNSTIQAVMTYKMNFIMGLLGSGLTAIITFYLWKAIFESSGGNNIRGFTFDEMIIYILISLITVRLTNNYVEYMVSEDVKSGSLAMNLIKPINYFLRLLFTAIGETIGKSILVNGPMIIGVLIYQIFYSRGTIPSFSTMVLYIVSIMLSFLIMIFFKF